MKVGCIAVTLRVLDIEVLAQESLQLWQTNHVHVHAYPQSQWLITGEGVLATMPPRTHSTFSSGIAVSPLLCRAHLCRTVTDSHTRHHVQRFTCDSVDTVLHMCAAHYLPQIAQMTRLPPYCRAVCLRSSNTFAQEYISNITP